MVHPVAIKRREVYGQRLIYVCDPLQANALAILTKKKTVDERDLEALKTLGIPVRDIDAEIKSIMEA